MGADGSLEKDILTGKMEGRARRGRPRMNFWDKVYELKVDYWKGFFKLEVDDPFWNMECPKT